MKRKTCLALIIVSIFMLTACNPLRPKNNVRTGLGAYGPGNEIAIISTDGYTSPERALDILNKQAEVKKNIETSETLTLLQKKLQDSINDGSDSEVKRINGIITMLSMENTPDAEYRNVKVDNLTTNYAIKLDAPFEEKVLFPGETTTYSVKLPIGLTPITYEECEIGSTAKCVRQTLRAAIRKTTTKISIVKK